MDLRKVAQQVSQEFTANYKHTPAIAKACDACVVFGVVSALLQVRGKDNHTPGYPWSPVLLRYLASQAMIKLLKRCCSGTLIDACQMLISLISMHRPPRRHCPAGFAPKLHAMTQQESIDVILHWCNIVFDEQACSLIVCSSPVLPGCQSGLVCSCSDHFVRLTRLFHILQL